MGVSRMHHSVLLVVGILLQFNRQYVSAGVFGASPVPQHAVHDPAAAAAAAAHQLPQTAHQLPHAQGLSGIPGAELMGQIPGMNGHGLPGAELMGQIPGMNGLGLPQDMMGHMGQVAPSSSPLSFMSPASTMMRDVGVAGLDATQAGLSVGGKAFRTGTGKMMDFMTAPLQKTPFGSGITAMRGMSDRGLDMGGNLAMKPFDLGRQFSNKGAGFFGAQPPSHGNQNQFMPGLQQQQQQQQHHQQQYTQTSSQSHGGLQGLPGQAMQTLQGVPQTVQHGMEGLMQHSPMAAGVHA